MTLVPLSSFGAQHNNRTLAFVTEARRVIDWDNHPVLMSSNEAKTIDFNKVLPVLQGIDLTPSLMAGLAAGDILSDTIRAIDDLYKRMIVKYKESRDLAFGNDLDIILDLKKRCTNKPFKDATIGLGAGGVVGGGIGVLISGPVGIIAVICGLIMGGYSFWSSKADIDQSIAKEGSLHRIQWIQSIHLLEKERMESMKEILTFRCKPLVRELSEMAADEEIDRPKFKELEQISNVFYACFPQGEHLIIDSINVRDFVNRLSNLIG